MVLAGAVVGPRVGVGVELDEGEGAVLTRVRLQERQTDEVIAAQREEFGATGDDLAGTCFDVVCDAVRVLGFDVEVAPVNRGQNLKRIAAVREAVTGAQFGGCGADGAGSEARAGAVARRAVVRHATDDGFGAGEIAGIRAAQEAQRAAVGHFQPTGAGIIAPERLITG